MPIAETDFGNMRDGNIGSSIKGLDHI